MCRLLQSAANDMKPTVQEDWHRPAAGNLYSGTGSAGRHTAAEGGWGHTHAHTHTHARLVRTAYHMPVHKYPHTHSSARQCRLQPRTFIQTLPVIQTQSFTGEPHL